MSDADFGFEPDVQPAAVPENFDFQPDAPPASVSVDDGFQHPQLTEVAIPKADTDKDDAIRAAWSNTIGKDPDVDAEVTRLSEQLKTGKRVILDNLPRFRALADDVRFKPEDLRAIDPVLYDLIGTDPEMATQVRESVKEDLSTYKKILRGAGALSAIVEKGRQAGLPTSREMAAAQRMNAAVRKASGEQLPPVPTFEESQALVQASQEPRTIENAVVDPLANEPSSVSRTVKILGARVRDDYRQAVASGARADAALAILGGASPETLRSLNERALRAKLDAGDNRYYGDQPLGSLSDAFQGVQSSLQTLIAGGGAALATAGVAAVATRVAGPEAGALVNIAQPWIAKAAGASVSFRQELGGYLMEADDIRTDDGKPIDEPTKLATGVLYATIASIIETANELGEHSAAVQSLGPLGAVVSGKSKREFMQIVLSSPTARAVVDLVAKRALGEAVEEGSQQTAQEAIEYMAKSVTDGKLNTPDIEASFESVLASAGGGYAAGLLLGAGGHVAGAATSAVVKLASGVRAENAKITESAIDPDRLAAARAVAASLTGQRSPKLAAEIIKGESAQSGSQLDSLWFKAEGLAAAIAKEGTNPDVRIEQLAGPGAAAALRDALASGDKFSVPVATYVDMTQDGIAETLKDDSSSGPDVYTPNELKAEQEKLDAMIQQILASDPELVQTETAPASYTGKLEEQLATTGHEDPAAAMAAQKAFTATVAERLGIDPDEAFGGVNVSVERAQANAVAAPNTGASRALARMLTKMSPEQRSQAMWIDRNTGLLNKRAFAALPENKNRPLVAHYSVEGTKWKNKQGHTAGNELYRLAGQELGKLVDDAAKWGGDFVSSAATEQEAQDVAAKMQEAMRDRLRELNPEIADKIEGIHVSAVTVERGPDVSTAVKAAGEKNAATKATLEESGARAKRGMKPLGIPVDNAADLKLSSEPAAPRAVPAGLQTPSGQDVFNSSYIDPSTGMLSSEGFFALKPKKNVISIDLNGLRSINEKFGENVGDDVLAVFAEAAKASGASALDMAHLSGDEYAAQTDNSELAQYFVDILGELSTTLKVENDDGSTIDGVSFGYGIGKDYDSADSLVEHHKQREKQRPGAEAEARASRALDRRGRGVPQGAERLARGNTPQGFPGVRERTAGSPSEARAASRAVDNLRRSAFRETDPKEVARLLSQANSPETAAAAAPAVQRLTQSEVLYQAPNDHRGWIEIAKNGTQRQFKIFLGEHADNSTFLHESGHAFMEMLGDISEHENAPESIKQDWQKVLSYVGAKDRQSLTESHKEKFARSFEAYLMEGKAPSSKLVSAFQRMRLWLLDVYKSITNLGVKLDDNIRGVFDRMLATDSEIASMRAAMGTQGQNFDQAAELAGLRVRREIAEEQRRVTSDAWQTELRKTRSIAETEYDAQPAAKAKQYLKDSESKDGPSLDSAAEAFGFASGQAMLDAVARLPARDAAVRARADELARSAHPEIVSERDRLEQSVKEALHSEATTDALLQEWKDFLKQSRRAGNPDLSVIREHAEQIVGRMNVRRLDPVRVIGRERAMAESAVAAAAKGDFNAAADAKLKQLISHMQWKEIEQVKKERKSFETLTGKLTKDSYRERLGKAGPAYRDVVDDVLEAIGAAKPTETESPRLSPHELVAVMQENGQSVAFDPAWLTDLIRNPKDWKDLSVAEMRAAQAALTNIKKGATQRNTVLIDGRRELKDAVVARAVAEAERNMPDLGPKVAEAARNIGQVAKSGVAAFDGYLLTIPTMVEWLGAESTESVWHRAIIKPLREAAATENDLIVKTVKPIIEAMEKIPAEVRKHWNDKVDGPSMFPNHREDLIPSRRFEIVLMALNRGNESNTERLTKGRGITLQEIDNAISTLSREELGWVQSIWDASESLWPLARDLEERDTGVAPDKLALQPFTVTLKDGTAVAMKGGYFPAIYDKDVSRAGARQAEAAVNDMMPVANRPSTSKGYLKSRAENFSDAIDLSPRGIQAGLVRVAHDIAFREPLRSVAGVISDKTIQDTMRRRLGAERSVQLTQWLRDIGRFDAASADPHAPGFQQFIQKMKSNTGVAVLGYAVDNTIGDIVAIPQAVVATPLRARHAAAGLAQFVSSPSDTRSFAVQSSGQVRLRNAQVKHEFKTMNSALGKSNILPARLWRGFRDHAFVVHELIDDGVSTVVWTGAYRQAAGEGKTHAAAVEFADDVLVKSMPASSVVDKSAIQRSRGMLGAMSMFYGYYNLVYQQERRVFHQIHTAEGAAQTTAAVAKAAGAHLALIAVARLMAGVIIGKGPEPEDGEVKGERWLSWFVRNMLVGSLDALPFGISGEIEKRVLGREAGTKALPANAAFDMIEKAVKKAIAAADDDSSVSWIDAVTAAIKAAGVFTGTPTRPLRPIEFLNEATSNDSKLEVRGPGDVVGGMLYSGGREKHADNIPTMLQDLASGD